MNKRYLVKIFNTDGTLKKTISENIISSEIRFSANINGGQGNLDITLNENFNDTSIEKSDFVKVTIFNENFPNWKLLYTWIIERIIRIFTARENQIQLVCLWLESLLTRLFFEKTASKVFNENKDAGDIVRDIITYFNSIYTGNWINDGEVWLVGSNTNIDFNFTTCSNALIQLAETNWFYYFIKADWTVVFQAKNNWNDHRFMAESNLQEIRIEEDTSNLKNVIYLDFDWGSSLESDIPSQNTYGRIESQEIRSELKDQNSGDNAAANILAEKKDPKQKVRLQVNANYPIENINPWDTIRINNLDYQINNAQIQRIRYTPELIDIDLEEFDSLWKILNR